MADTLLRNELIENIPELRDDETLLSECLAICKNHNKSGTDLRYEWEARSFQTRAANRDSELRVFTMDDAKAMKADLVAKYQRQVASREQQLKANAQRANVMSAIMRRKEPVIMSASRPSNAAASSSADAAATRVTFKRLSEDVKKRKYRYMYEKVSERSEILDEKVDEFGEMIRNFYNTDDLGDPSDASEEDVVVVGRICSDIEAFSSRLTEDSIVIESSRMMGSGARVPLRFGQEVKLRGMSQGMTSTGLFPGAIVALKGRNGGGNSFVVSEILGIPRMLSSPEPAGHKAFNMVAACGPFTTDANMEYQLFKTFMEKLTQVKPSVVLLLGPFIDIHHPSIRSFDLEDEPTKIFAKRIGAPLLDFLQTCPDTLILLSPSLRDFMSDHPVYPQPELDSIFKDPRVRMIPNPSRFSINGVSFCCTSVDVLFHLRAQEYTHHGVPVDPVPTSSPAADVWVNTCRHILSQRCIYPVFPVPTELSSEVNLDVTHSEFLRVESGPEGYAPDVLILPSKYKQFAKDVDGMRAINPSFLTKKTYAVINVPDTNREGLRQAMTCEIEKL